MYRPFASPSLVAVRDTSADLGAGRPGPSLGPGSQPAVVAVGRRRDGPRDRAWVELQEQEQERKGRQGRPSRRRGVEGVTQKVPLSQPQMPSFARHNHGR